MWELSDDAQRLVARLHHLRTRPWWLSWKRGDTDIVNLLEQIAELKQPGALPAAAMYLLADSVTVRAVACRAVDRLLSVVPRDELLHLYDVVGHAWDWYISEDWQKLRPSSVAGLVADEAVRTSVLGLVSFHRNGFVRHEAVRHLANAHDGSELPYLLIRQNDWVEAISAEARAAVRARLNAAYARHFAANLPLVVHLLAFRRRDHEPVVRQVVELLVQPQHHPLLAQAIDSPNRLVRREVVRLALDLNDEHRRRIVERGLASEDDVLRLWSARRLRSAFSGESLRKVLEMLKRDGFMPVRREALLIDAALSPERAPTIWRQALLDRSASLRELARFHLAKMGRPVAASVYREALGDDPASLAALEGLAEAGDRSDLPLLKAYLKDPRPTRRRAALHGVARLGGEGVVDELVESLRDDSPSVVREASWQLNALRRALTAEQLYALAIEDRRPHVREAAVRLIFGLGKWESLPWLIRATVRTEPETASLAQSLVEAWFTPPLCNKIFTRPSKSERRAIGTALAESRTRMPEPFLKKLEAWLE